MDNQVTLSFAARLTQLEQCRCLMLYNNKLSVIVHFTAYYLYYKPDQLYPHLVQNRRQ